MKLKLSFKSSKEIILPSGYNHLLHNLIIHVIERPLTAWFIRENIPEDDRDFEFFCFSEIQERPLFDKMRKEFIFPPQITFTITSPVNIILEQTASGMIKSQFFNLGNSKIEISGIEMIPIPQLEEEQESIKVRALTPIDAHTMVKKSDELKIPHYFTPFDEQFSQISEIILKKKWEILMKETCPYDISIKPLFNESTFSKIVYFGPEENRTAVKGWTGNYLIEGKKDILKFALESGIGKRNSIGFGMIEIITE